MDQGRANQVREMRARRPRLCLYRTASGSERIKRGGQDAREPPTGCRRSNGGSPMRSIWKGHIRFLLVAIPIRVYNAIEASEKIQFNQLHREDFGPVGYDKRCKKCSQIVTNDQITKGYQYEPDRYALVEPDEIAKIKIKTTKAIDIIGFVDSSEIPRTFDDAPYYLGPDGAVAEKPYALLRQVLKDTGKVGLAKVVLRDREDLVAVFPLENGIVLQKLRYPAEIRKMQDVPEVDAAPKIDKKELQLATSLVEQMVTSFS